MAKEIMHKNVSQKNVNPAFLRDYLSSLQVRIVEGLENENSLTILFKHCREMDDLITLMSERVERRAANAERLAQRVPITDEAAAFMRTQGVRYHEITPTGKGGAQIVLSDVRAAAGIEEEHGSMDGHAEDADDFEPAPQKRAPRKRTSRVK